VSAPAIAHGRERLERGRYAPSPTGALHLGNLRTALLAWLVARASGGAFVLRMEDLDTPRTRLGAAVAILDDLRWLGLDWDEGPDTGGPLGPYVQSQRHALYTHALARLREQGLLYPCYCTRSELEVVASAPHAGEHERSYPGICRDLTARERAQREAQGRRPALRLRVPKAPITFVDALAGAMTENVADTVGDFVVRRSDGLFAYQLAVVVDDALMGITQVVRGADLLPSTARQLVEYDALGFPRPARYLHVPLALDAAGTRLSKRDASAGLAPLRASGTSPECVVGALAASCGLWPEGEPATLDALLAGFDLARLPREPSVLAP
jgi:glutamyl-tRNA synthetase